MPGSLLGNIVPRVEDPALLAGRGRYVDDISPDDLLHAYFVRSTIPHGRIRSIDVDEARQMPGVVAVLTAQDLGLTPTMGILDPKCPRPPLADGKVCFVGDPVVVVLAETRAAAVDAAEAVIVDYEPLAAVSDMEAALALDAPIQNAELATNLVLGNREGDGAAVLSDAEVVVRARIENQRVAVVPMEGSAVLVIPGSADDEYALTVYPTTQSPHMYWGFVAREMGLDQSKVRVVVPDVGGSFGAKGFAVEHLVAAKCAQRYDRPVKWAETRSENMVGMLHGRGQVQYIEMGFTRAGRITGLRCRIVGDAGAYGGFGGMLPTWTTRRMATGPYKVPKLAYETAIALTNTTPMGAFRGAGRPEAAAYLERIMDVASDELGIDPVELRRRNLIGPDEFPYTTPTGAVYDSGDYAASLDEALRIAGYDALRAEQAERRARGDRVQLGIGIAVYVEVTGGANGTEWGAIDVHEDGTATIRVGTSAHGQGHATAFSMIASDTLGIPLDRIRFVQSDTAVVPRGGGTGGSRSLQIGGAAVLAAGNAVLARARDVAARLLEASPEDIVVDDGRLGVTGVPTSGVEWSEVAKAAAADGEPLAAEVDVNQEGATFPFGAHVAVVEIDTETGRVELRRHIAVDDCGRIVSPLIVAGQQHGGVAAGAAQALWEQMVYDSDGTPLTTTLMDYAMPSAAELPSFETANTQTPSPLNPLGAKGIGESGTVGATPAVHNAVVDALAHLGIRHIDMPCTPERVWRSIVDARAGVHADPWREPPAVFESLPRADAEGEGLDINI